MTDRTPGIGPAPRKTPGECARAGRNGAARTLELFMQEGYPSGPFIQAFEQSEMSKYELAAAMGWMKPDTDRVNRFLRSRFVRQETAGALARALGADPVEFGV